MTRCLNCNKEFKKNRSWQKFCKTTCRWQYWDKQNPRVKKIIPLILLAIIFFSTPVLAETLKASWYSEASLKKEGTWAYSKGVMANGELFNEMEFTCATRLYPFRTILKITNKENGKSVIAIVTDRISKRFATTRIDLSKSAFMQIANLKQGLVEVSIKEVRNDI